MIDNISCFIKRWFTTYNMLNFLCICVIIFGLNVLFSNEMNINSVPLIFMVNGLMPQMLLLILVSTSVLIYNLFRVRGI